MYVCMYEDGVCVSLYVRAGQDHERVCQGTCKAGMGVSSYVRAGQDCVSV